MRHVLAATVACCGLLAAQRTPPLDDPLPAAIAWFDRLGYPTDEGLHFVRIPTGTRFNESSGEPEDVHVLGLMLHHAAGPRRVLTLDLTVWEFPLGADGNPQRPGPVWVECTADEVAAELLAQRDGSPEIEPDAGHPHLSLHARCFVAAQICQANGATAMAERLAAASYPVERLPTLLQQELGHATWWRIVLAFGDPSLPYAALHERIRAFLQHFPDSPHKADAVAADRQLEQMQAAALAHAAPANLAGLPQNARIGELVYRLRDHHSWHWILPPRSRAAVKASGAATPAHLLSAEGLAAVPALVSVFDDTTFTRSVRYHRECYFSHEVLRVGDAAQAILFEITGQRFDNRAEAEAWAQRLAAEGPDAAHARAVVERGASGSAERLLTSDPQRLQRAVHEALAAAHPDDTKARLLAIVGGVAGSEVDALLHQQLSTGGHRTRLAAALALYLRGQQELAMEATIRLWHELSDAIADDPNLKIGELQQTVGNILAALGGTNAIAALAARTHAIGHYTIQALGGERPFVRAWWPGGHLDDRLPRTLAVRPAPDAEIAALLFHLLGDRTVLIGGYNETVDPRRCDFAAVSLVSLRPTLPAFDFGAEVEQRDQQIARIQAASTAR